MMLAIALILTVLQTGNCRVIIKDDLDSQSYARVTHHQIQGAERVNLPPIQDSISSISLAPRAEPPSVVYPTHHRRLSARDLTTTVTVRVITSVLPLGTAQILPSPSDKTPCTTGSIQTSLDRQGRGTEAPLLTSSIEKPASLLAATATAYPDAIVKASMASPDIFAEPIATGAPPANIKIRPDHPLPRLGIAWTPPLSTNKFYANKFLGGQACPDFLHPYSVAWAKGQGPSGSWGMTISHVDANQRVFGPTDKVTGAASYFINPVGIQSICISAQELGSTTTMTTDQLHSFSVRVSLRPNAQASAAVQFPLVQGAGFITAIFNGARPLIESGVLFKSVVHSATDPKPGVTKYKLNLEDGKTWLLYAYHTKGAPLDLQVVNNGMARAKGPFYGIIQVAKDPGNGEAVYDQACGAYATGVELSGTSSGTTGTYTFGFQKGGMAGGKLAMFALPHHQASFDDATKAAMTQVKLQTTTKGVAVAVLADSWKMVESALPTNMGFVPWSPSFGSMTTLSQATKEFIHGIALEEVSQDMDQQSNLDSMYFSGKALAKFATVIMTINDLLGDEALARSGLNKLKSAFARFADNKQKFPLVYEHAWGGVVSSASYVTGDANADFGNSYYNDHHFHYGYFIYCAAVIAHLDPSWIAANKDYVNTLVRDVANPSAKDKFFPVWRNFDWYHGHSWAHGLYEVMDGKDQESSSEDVMHAYAIKMWGEAIGDQNMAARSNLQLAILTRSLASYYLYTSDNTIQPKEFIGNKVAGILFENKIDHTTYFGTNIEYIQGINMLPLLPSTPLTRSARFVREEWAAFFDNGRADRVAGGWKGILYGNYATVDPEGAYRFFSSASFDPSWLDGGASRTWYLAYSAALAGL